MSAIVSMKRKREKLAFADRLAALDSPKRCGHNYL
jgi:hypothetical protein